MHDPVATMRKLSVPETVRPKLKKWVDQFGWWNPIRILVVTDEEIATGEFDGFGLGRVIKLLRETNVGCTSFTVDIAQRSLGVPTVVANPQPFSPKYTGFQFDMRAGGQPVIYGYHQIWIFGFKPGNDGGLDENIENPSSVPATDPELAVLTDWMDNRRGGVFATGDHDYLGASICHRIPRVSTMRRWTNAEGVPPISTSMRIDTLRPAVSGSFVVGSEGDSVAQPIEWVAWASVRAGWFYRKVRPHPVLCHPTLGPIDVMPDHPHEGLCFPDDQVDLTRSYDFDGSGPKLEYRVNVVGPQVRPRVIAYGSTLPDPPYDFPKGEQPYRPRFPMMSVYDGHSVGCGRVATDSTWHHWFNLNINQFALDDGPTWEKISRYYINLALWLNPPGVLWPHWWGCYVVAQFGYAGFQEFSPKMTTLELGAATRNWFGASYGPCWISQFVFEVIAEFDEHLALRLFDDEIPRLAPERPWPPRPEPCLSCPSIEPIENFVLGGISRELVSFAGQLKEGLAAGKGFPKLAKDVVTDLVRSGAQHGLSEYRTDLAESVQKTTGLLNAWPEGTDGPGRPKPTVPKPKSKK